jgi:hypothetical protein
MSEFSEVLDGGSIVGSGGLFWGIKSPQVPSLALSFPLSLFFVPANALVSRFVVFVYDTISLILRLAAWAQVLAPIIQRVMVRMVYILRFRKYFSVHENHVTVALVPYISRSVNMSIGARYRKPFPLRQVLKVFTAHLGNLAFGKCNFAVGWFWGHGRSSVAARIRPVLLTPDPSSISVARGF